MQMKANKAFYVIGGITALVVTLMAGFLFSGGSSSNSNTAETKKEDTLDISFKDLSPEELRAMGIEGDTSKDTVRTLMWGSDNICIGRNKKIWRGKMR